MSAIAVDGGRVAGIQAEELAARFGTPLYVYDFDAVIVRVEALRAALPPSFELAYAAKANPALAVLALMVEAGLGLDIASGGELLAAERIGFDPRRIVFTGPGKTDAELAAAADAGLRAITVESAGELGRLERIAAAAGRRVPILLRVALRGEGEETPILAGGWRKFGIDPSELESVARRACASPWLDLLGLHAFGASNVREADAIAAHVARTVALAADLAQRTSFRLRLVDAGGGLGIPYTDHEQPLDLHRLGDRLTMLAAGWCGDLDLTELPVLLEPGRYLVGPAGVLLARVLDVKRVGGRTVAILDAGIHTALRPALVGEGHRLRLLAAGERPPAEDGAVLVAGPLCTGLDVFPGGLDRVPVVGDLVAILDLGAYGYSESMPWFLSHPVPAEVAVRGGRVELVRRRVEPHEGHSMQELPAWGDVSHGLTSSISGLWSCVCSRLDRFRSLRERIRDGRMARFSGSTSSTTGPHPTRWPETKVLWRGTHALLTGTREVVVFRSYARKRGSHRDRHTPNSDSGGVGQRGKLSLPRAGGLGVVR